MTYFNKFPIINYNGILCRNIMIGAKLSDDIYSDDRYFTELDLETPLRSDVIAKRYYTNSNMDWIVHISNQVMNPYVDSYKSDLLVDTLIDTKYGSIEKAREKILFWRTNWYKDTKLISQSEYENLPINHKKYFVPSISSFNVLTGYTRKQEDWQLNTNKLANIELNNVEFLVVGGQYTLITYNETQDIIRASFVLDSIDYENNIIKVSNILGDINYPENSYIYTYTENKNITHEVLSIPFIFDNIQPDELKFWEPITAYDYEYELNFKKRNIKLIRDDLAQNVEIEFKKSLNE